MKFLVIFAVVSLITVIFSTAKSVILINGTILSAAVTNMIYYPIYNYVLKYSVADVPMWEKNIVTALCNLIGVALTLKILKRLYKDKLWLVKMTIPAAHFKYAYNAIKAADIPVSYHNLNKYYVLDCYCENRKHTKRVKEIGKSYGGKMFATENKLMI